MWDVAVIGAGPAGSAAALRALQVRPGAQVLLLDSAAFPRDKPCGDGIAPHAFDVLAELGIGGVADDFLPVSRLRLRAPSGTEVARQMARPARVVPRRVFDARLVEAAAARGAVLHRHRVRRVEVQRDHVELDGEIAARVVVAADGANSVVRRQLGIAPNPPAHLALAIRGYRPAPAGPSEQLIVMSDVDWPAYAWSFPIGDGRANVGYGEVIRGRDQSRAGLLERLHALLSEAGVADGETAGLRAHHLPLSSRRPRQPDGPILLAGDALSLINPFTGEGIFYALRSGALAGEAACSARDAGAGTNAGARYRAALTSALGRHLRHTTVTSTLARWGAVVDAGVTAARGDQRVFDALVELGLGRGLLTAGVLGGVARNLVYDQASRLAGRRRRGAR